MRLFVIEKRVAKRYGFRDDAKSSEDENLESGSSENAQNSEEPEPSERQPLLGQVEHDEDEFKIAENPSSLTRTITILPCLKNPALVTALFLTLVQALTFGSFDATVTTVSRELFGFDSLKAGLLFLPLGVMDLVLSPLAGWSVDKYGTKPASVISYSLMTPVLVLLRLPHAGGLDQILFYAVLLALAGICLSGEGAPSIVEAGNVVRNYHERNPDFFGETGPYAQLFGLNSMIFNLGLTLGPELAGELTTAIGYGHMNIVLAVISAIAAVLSWVYVGGKPKAIKRSR
jgi:MFS family permease